MIKKVMKILEKAHTEGTNIPPTLLYNEGWMIRLLVEQSIENKVSIGELDFSKISKWYSEGLLSSPFLQRYRGDKLAEGYTHVDVVFGDFGITPFERGDIHVNAQGKILGIIEAKMGSSLSSGTKNQSNYNQASRNLACLAFNALNTDHKLYFIVVAPEEKIKEYGFKEIVNLEYMIPQIENRFDLYKEENDEIFQKKEAVVKRAKSCNCIVLSYEEWLDGLKETDVQNELNVFYHICKKFNKIG